MVVLDSTFLIDLSRRDPAARQLRARFDAEQPPLRVPAAAWVEYLAGFDPIRRGEQEKLLMDATTWEPFDRQVAAVAVRLQYELFRLGHPLGWHDLQIAATAIHYGEPVVTRDEWGKVPGLDAISY